MDLRGAIRLNDPQAHQRAVLRFGQLTTIRLDVVDPLYSLAGGGRPRRPTSLIRDAPLRSTAAPHVLPGCAAATSTSTGAALLGRSGTAARAQSLPPHGGLGLY